MYKRQPLDKENNTKIEGVRAPNITEIHALEHRIEIGPLTSIFKHKSLKNTISSHVQGLDLCLGASTTGIKARFTLISRPLEELKAKQLVEILEQHIDDYDVRTIRIHPQSLIENVPTGNVTRIRIGRSRSLDEIKRLKKRLKRVRRTWNIHIEARTTGPEPILSLVTGRLESEHAEEQAVILQEKMPEVMIEVDHDAQY